MINLTYPSNLPSELQGVQIIDVRETLPVNLHYTWTQLKGIRPVTDLTTIVLHHDAISKQSSAKYTDMQLAINISLAHIRSKKNRLTGDPGFPYDLWIRNGIIYFTNYVETLEYGVASNNLYTVNVCVSGNYAYGDILTDADRKALYVAYFLLKAVMPAYKAVRGHGEISPTQCPGYDMYKVRADLMDIEQRMIFESSAAHSKETAFKIAGQTMYLYNMAQGKLPDGSKASDGQVKWAVMMLNRLYPFMQENKLFG